MRVREQQYHSRLPAAISSSFFSEQFLALDWKAGKSHLTLKTTQCEVNGVPSLRNCYDHCAFGAPENLISSYGHLEIALFTKEPENALFNGVAASLCLGIEIQMLLLQILGRQ
jgi:hypothetical protein